MLDPYLIAQIVGFTATAIYLTYTLCKVNRSTIMICSIIINLLWATHYLILGAYTGAFCRIFTTFMVVICSFKGKNVFFKGPVIPIFFNICYIIIGIFTWAGISTVIQMIGNFILTISMWLDSEINIKTLFIPIGILWLIYNCIFFTWIGVISQSLAILFNVIYLIKYIVNKKKACQKSRHGPLPLRRGNNESRQKPCFRREVFLRACRNAA